MGNDGRVQATVIVGDAARAGWSGDGRLAVLGTHGGAVAALDAQGKVG